MFSVCSQRKNKKSHSFSKWLKIPQTGKLVGNPCAFLRKEKQKGKKPIPRKNMQACFIYLYPKQRCHRTDRLPQPTRLEQLRVLHLGSLKRLAPLWGVEGVQLLMTAEQAAPCQCDNWSGERCTTNHHGNKERRSQRAGSLFPGLRASACCRIEFQAREGILAAGACLPSYFRKKKKERYHRLHVCISIVRDCVDFSTHTYAPIYTGERRQPCDYLSRGTVQAGTREEGYPCSC